MTEISTGGAKLPEINAGYIPLIDSAVLLAAKELGLDTKYGFRLNLHKEVSWANIRDKVNVGLYDCAHMLAPMPIAASLGVGHVREPIIAPFALNLSGNAITVSRELFSHMMDMDPENAPAGGMRSALAIARVVEERKAKGQEPLTLGTVFPFSCHQYELCYWLASAGVDPMADVRLVVIPPPLIAASLKAGHIHGFCAGAPWPSLSVEEGDGIIVATKTELWRRSPEKVLGVRLAWVERNQELHTQLLRALSTAAQWLDEDANRIEAAKILSSATYLDLPVEILERSLLGEILRDKDTAPDEKDDFLVFYRDNANFPWRSHALWLLSQMVRWGQLNKPFDLRQAADVIYRPDIYRAALRDTGITMPISDVKVEGRATEDDRSFYGGEVFDPANVVGYIQSAEIKEKNIDLSAFAALNE